LRRRSTERSSATGALVDLCFSRSCASSSFADARRALAHTGLRYDLQEGNIRLGADIGDVTDIARTTRHIFGQVLTTTRAGKGDLDGVAIVTREAGISPAEIALSSRHNARNHALIERRGAKTASSRRGFRDVIEMRNPSRFEQYDLNLECRRAHPREHRSPSGEKRGGTAARAARRGALKDRELIAARLRRGGIGFIHSYANPARERRAGGSSGKRYRRRSRSRGSLAGKS